MEKRNINSCPEPKGILLVIGGRENKGDESSKNLLPKDAEDFAILKEFIGLIKKENSIIEVCTTPSGVADESFEEYEKIFKELGAGTVRHLHHNTRLVSLDESLAKRVNEADAFFFTGGDQLKLTSRYGGTDFLSRVKNRYINEEIVIAGTSAGAMAMSTPMIYAGNEKVQQIGGQIKITTGLEFLKDICIDTHFVERGRFVRMAQVIVTNPGCIGIGIEEDSAIIVRNGLDAEVIGTGIIIIIDGFNITQSNVEEFTSDEPISIRDLRVHILKRGDKYSIPQPNPPHH
ncbi:MAG: hypothetical protein JWQ96_2023 [Segetibacter sp.]|nr:hypothetical protein [Segetibacter sp.]